MSEEKKPEILATSRAVARFKKRQRGKDPSQYKCAALNSSAQNGKRSMATPMKARRSSECISHAADSLAGASSL
jgi:hypothetical protein